MESKRVIEMSQRQTRLLYGKHGSVVSFLGSAVLFGVGMYVSEKKRTKMETRRSAVTRSAHIKARGKPLSCGLLDVEKTKRETKRSAVTQDADLKDNGKPWSCGLLDVNFLIRAHRHE